jgi:hypothetical protein
MPERPSKNSGVIGVPYPDLSARWLNGKRGGEEDG